MAGATKQESPRATDPIRGVPLEARPLRVLLFVLTAFSAAAALFVEPALADAVRRGAVGRSWLFLPLGLYALFFLAYAVDRAILVKRRRYPAGRAFFQLAFGAVFALLLLPSTIEAWGHQAPSGHPRLLTHPDPEVRVASLHELGFFGPDDVRVGEVTAKLEDGHPAVRRAAAEVLARWSGRDEGDLPGLKAWAADERRVLARPAECGTSTKARGEGG